MTRQRNDNHSTEFGLWLRDQEEIDSRLGFVATNVDYIWTNYKTNQWMVIEEKRYCSDISYSQKQQFRVLDSACRSDPDYRGFHLVVFEQTSPDDGDIWVNRKRIDKETFVEFLKFKTDETGFFDRGRPE